MPISQLVDWCRQYELQGIDGITISGGEPFEQSEALEALLRELHTWTDKLDPPVDYLCYSGLPFSVLQDKHQVILSLIDVIVPEPYIAELTGKAIRGSNNQPIIPLTELGKNRFAGFVDETLLQQGKRMQLAVEDGSVWFIGIPEHGDMEKLVELCKGQGLHISNLSWE
jgi:anaerobic ribonucleoside-triphosphate reductase activating protein